MEMRPEELKVGALYRLVRDVKNPVVDKRSRNPFLLSAVFKEGSHFVCLCTDDIPTMRRLHTTRTTLSGNPSADAVTVGLAGDDGFRLSTRPKDQNWTAAIVPHLEEVPIDSFKTLRMAYGWGAMPRVLRALVDDGTVPLERVVELMREHTIGASMGPGRNVH